MRRLVAVAPVVCAAFLACSSDDGVHVGVAPTIVFPEGTLDTVTALKLSVYDASGGVDCNTTKGVLVGSGPVVASKDLATSGCAANAKFCGDVQIEKSATPRVFLAQGFAAGNTTPVATGCTKATVNQDTLQVQIKMLRFAPPATCGGKPSPLPAVQCDTPGDSADTVCGTDCVSKELFVSPGDGSFTSSSKAKARPSFVWAGGHFVAFFGDKSPPSRTQVSMRLLGDDLHTDSTFGPAIETASYFMPNDSSGIVPNGGDPGSQYNPAAVLVNGTYYVACENNAKGPLAITLRSLTSPIKSGQGAGSPIAVSMGASTATQPSIAASGDGKLFVAWQSSGAVVGRTVDPTSFALGTQQTLSTQGQNVVVAGLPSGFVAAYESGTDVKMITLDGTGAPKGGEQKVNDGTHSGTQVHPGVASLGDGRFAIDWVDTGSQGGAGVFVQRYGADGKPVANDQAVRINGNTGDQSNTALGAGSTFYVAAWVDSNGHVRARLLDGASGFLFNSVTGQDDDFQVSLTDGRMRSNPTIAVGGAAGPFIAIGWEDDTTGLTDPAFPGIWARRFPVPQ